MCQARQCPSLLLLLCVMLCSPLAVKEHLWSDFSVLLCGSLILERQWQWDHHCWCECSGHLGWSMLQLRPLRHASDHICAAAAQKLDPGAAVAVGAPLLVRMFVPLWVVNATSLPVAAWVVLIQAPPPPSDREPGPSEGLVDPADSIRLQTLETENVQLPQSALRRCASPWRFLPSHVVPQSELS